MPAEPVREPVGNLRRCAGGLSGNVAGRTGPGLAAQQALDEWLEFAAQAGYLRVTGERTFGSDLDRLAVEEEEARSLFAFARSKGLGFPEKTLEIAKHSPSAGATCFPIAGDGRVGKSSRRCRDMRTFSRRLGRPWRRGGIAGGGS